MPHLNSHHYNDIIHTPLHFHSLRCHTGLLSADLTLFSSSWPPFHAYSASSMLVSIALDSTQALPCQGGRQYWPPLSPCFCMFPVLLLSLTFADCITYLSVLWPCPSSLQHWYLTPCTKSSALHSSVIIPACIRWQCSSTGGDVEAGEAKAVQKIILPIVGREDSIPHALWEQLMDI